jgi:hypothetical protein
VTPDGGKRFNENKALHCPTPLTPVFEKIGDFRGLSNPSEDAENENPGALAGASGAMSNDQKIVGKVCPKARRSAMSLFAKDGHKRACKMLGYALTLNDPAIWGDTAAIFALRLSPPERAALAYTALRTLEPEAREAVFDAAHWGLA